MDPDGVFGRAARREDRRHLSPGARSLGCAAAQHVRGTALRRRSAGPVVGRPRICIVSHAAYRALTGSESGHIGGVERQTAMLARYLVGRGYAVDFVTWREGDGDEAERNVEGIRLLPICRRDDGVPGVRFFHPRWTSLLAALRRSNADVYYHNTA